jgi:hypothetical protein
MTREELMALGIIPKDNMSIDPTLVPGGMSKMAFLPESEAAKPVEVVKQEEKPVEKETPWAKTEEGQSTIEGAKLGMQSGDIGSTLTSAGIFNMLGKGGFTPAGGALVAGGLLLSGAKQAHEADYANKLAVAKQQEAVKANQLAALYKLHSGSFSTVG